MDALSEYNDLYTLVSYARQTLKIEANTGLERAYDACEYGNDPFAIDEYDCNILYGVSAYDMNA